MMCPRGMRKAGHHSMLRRQPSRFMHKWGLHTSGSPVRGADWLVSARAAIARCNRNRSVLMARCELRGAVGRNNPALQLRSIAAGGPRGRPLCSIVWLQRRGSAEPTHCSCCRLCLNVTCVQCENGKSVSPIDSAQPTMAHGADTDSDLARPPDGLLQLCYCGASCVRQFQIDPETVCYLDYGLGPLGLRARASSGPGQILHEI
jgi:hypothetical protein